MFIAKGVNLTTVGAQTLTAASGATISFTTTAAGGNAGTATTQTTATALAASIQKDLRSTTVYDTRAIACTAGTTGNIVTTTFNGSILQRCFWYELRTEIS